MLAHQGIISARRQRQDRSQASTRSCQRSTAAHSNSRARLEDIHHEHRGGLAALIGPAAGRLHTARSRQRPGGARFPPVGERGAAEDREGVTGLIAALSRPRRRACRHGDARLHPFANGAAGHLRDITAWPMWKCSAATARAFATDRAHGRKPDRRSRACRHRFPSIGT